MQGLTSRYHITVDDAVNELRNLTNDSQRFAIMLTRGSLQVELYTPYKQDLQQPHNQDELYVVVAGQGDFINGDHRHPFGPGDVLFVPAGVEHRFENFSDDFQTWVIFYGPQGGEQPVFEPTSSVAMD